MSMQICPPTVAGFVSFCQNKLPKFMAGRSSLANMAINRPFSRDFFVAPLVVLEVCLLYNEIINAINMIFILISDMLGLFHPGGI